MSKVMPRLLLPGGDVRGKEWESFSLGNVEISGYLFFPELWGSWVAQSPSPRLWSFLKPPCLRESKGTEASGEQNLL